MKKIFYKSYSFIKTLIKELERKNREDLIYELLIVSELEKENIAVFKVISEKFKNHILTKKEYFNLEIEEIELFTKVYLNKQEIFIENFDYNIEFIKK
jgi:hypothetical protein